MRITVFDYGAGNLHSLAKALSAPDRDVSVEADPVAALATDLLVLPGVGHFTPAARRIASARDAMRRAILGGLPTLGICLGMQLLCETSEEGEGDGLAIIAGEVTRLRARRLPQIGWNTLEPSLGDSIAEDAFAVSGLGIAYYANSYACRVRDGSLVTAWSEHDGDRFAAAVRVGQCVGVQFHPEKSSAAGRRFLDRIVHSAARVRGFPSN